MAKKTVKKTVKKVEKTQPVRVSQSAQEPSPEARESSVSRWLCDGLLGPNGRFYNFRPEDAVGGGSGGNVQVQPISERAGYNEAVEVVKEPDGTYTIVVKGMSAANGREVVVSSPDASGSVQTRFRDQRFADETFTFVEPTPTGSFEPPYTAWCVHTRHNQDGLKLIYAPTLFTVVNPKKVE